MPTVWKKKLRGRDIPPCLDSLGLERPKKTYTIQLDSTVHHPGRQKKKLIRIGFFEQILIKICFEVIWYVLGNKVHKKKCKHNFLHLISKTGYSFPVCCSSLPLKVMGKRLKLPVSVSQARGSYLEKQEFWTPRAARAGTGGQEKTKLHMVRDIQQLHWVVPVPVFWVSQGSWIANI